MGKWISGLFLGALALGLSIFTGSRTLDLLAWALPTGQQIYQWLGLCAFEGGMLFWSYYFIQGAKGTPQRSISIVMACFSIIAVSVCTVADLSLGAGQKGEIAALTADQAQSVIIFVGVVIVVNVAAYLACHLLSVENMRRMKEQEAEDKIYEAGLRAISGLAPSIAADAAPYLAEEWANRTWQRIVPGVKHETRYLPQESRPAISAPAPAPAQPRTVESRKPNFIDRGVEKAKNFFAGEKKPETIRMEQTGSIDTPIKPSEKTSNQIYREQQRAHRVNTSAVSMVAQRRRLARQQRFSRPAGNIIDVHGNPITSASIKKEKERPEPTTEKVEVPVLPLATRPAGDQGANSPTKNTRGPGSRGKKQASRAGVTNAR